MLDGKKTRSEHGSADIAALTEELCAHGVFIEGLCSQANALRWGCSTRGFAGHLARSVAWRFKSQGPSWEEVEAYVGTLHLEDFALACGCADDAEAAWEYFVSQYRGYLRRCAGAMLRRGAESPEARELADSLFAELYGLADGRRGTASLFRYFHGRSSLKTWLRAVLAQRHVDGIRAARRFDALDEEDGAGQHTFTEGTGGRSRENSGQPRVGPLTLPPDPHRERYIALFCNALRSALEKLEATDHRRICLYYAEGKTLAEIGRLCGEHESSVSRNLERIRRELHAEVAENLRQGVGDTQNAATDGAAQNGLSEAQIALCLQYATEDAPIDFNLLFPGEGPTRERGSSRRDGGKTTRPETGRQK
jgi:RNA polymerase sigma factor (sigma-70 family)